MSETKKVAGYVDESLAAVVEDMAEDRGTSVSEQVAAAVERYVRDGGPVVIDDDPQETYDAVTASAQDVRHELKQEQQKLHQAESKVDELRGERASLEAELRGNDTLSVDRRDELAERYQELPDEIAEQLEVVGQREREVEELKQQLDVAVDKRERAFTTLRQQHARRAVNHLSLAFESLRWINENREQRSNRRLSGDQIDRICEAAADIWNRDQVNFASDWHQLRDVLQHMAKTGEIESRPTVLRRKLAS